jgi:hypothetical protein
MFAIVTLLYVTVDLVVPDQRCRLLLGRPPLVVDLLGFKGTHVTFVKLVAKRLLRGR